MYLEHRLLVLLRLYLYSQLNTWLQYIAQRQLQDEMWDIYVLRFGVPYIKDLMVYLAECHTLYQMLAWWNIRVLPHAIICDSNTVAVSESTVKFLI